MMSGKSLNMPKLGHTGVQPLRAYPADSPSAKARLLALAMFADGYLHDAEMASLHSKDIFAQLGISPDLFSEVLSDFCADIEKLPVGGNDYLLPPAIIEQLLNEIKVPAERKKMLHQIFDMLRSDGQLTDSELEFFLQAVTTWKQKTTTRQ